MLRSEDETTDGRRLPAPPSDKIAAAAAAVRVVGRRRPRGDGAQAEQPPSDRRHWLSLEKKMEVVRNHSRGERIAKLARVFGVSRHQISNIVARRAEIARRWENGARNDSKRLSAASCRFGELNDRVYEWYRGERSVGRMVTGPALQKQALAMAGEMGLDKFAASNGWLESFQKRNNISFRADGSGPKRAGTHPEGGKERRFDGRSMEEDALGFRRDIICIKEEVFNGKEDEVGFRSHRVQRPYVMHDRTWETISELYRLANSGGSEEVLRALDVVRDFVLRSRQDDKNSGT